MGKISVGHSNNFCPQTLFLYGTYGPDGAPNFGLFCWFSYCWDGGLAVMASIGGAKLTKDRVRESGVFSANLVSQQLLPLADYLGNTEGGDPAKRARIVSEPLLESVPGQALRVPVLALSPWSYELEVSQTIALDDSEVYICKIRNVLADERLTVEDLSVEARLRLADPAITTAQTYFKVGARAGCWSDWKNG